MRSKLAAMLAVFALAASGSVLAGCGGDEEETTTTTVTEPAPDATTTDTTTNETTTAETTTGDATTAETTTGETTTGEAEDVSGNCDEAEHADDPECVAGSSGSGSGGVYGD